MGAAAHKESKRDENLEKGQTCWFGKLLYNMGTGAAPARNAITGMQNKLNDSTRPFLYFTLPEEIRTGSVVVFIERGTITPVWKRSNYQFQNETA